VNFDDSIWKATGRCHKNNFIVIGAAMLGAVLH